VTVARDVDILLFKRADEAREAGALVVRWCKELQDSQIAKAMQQKAALVVRWWCARGPLALC
jgi:hypothetical protein